MIMSNDLRPGMTISVDNEIYVVLDISQNKTARSGMVVKTKVRNLRSGANIELSYNGGEKVAPAHIDKKEMQYLYDDEESLIFMDTSTYEQIEVPKSNVEWELKFIKGNDNVTISMYEGEILGLILPDKATLQVVECEPAVKGDTATSASKNAVLETGLEIKVPLFISEGEMIVVNTADGKYSGRSKE